VPRVFVISLVHLANKGWQLGNGRAVAVGGLIAAIIGTIATVAGVWLQVKQPQLTEPKTTVIETATTSVPAAITQKATTEPAETEITPTSRPEITETSRAEITEIPEPLFTNSTLQEVFGHIANADCRDVDFGYAKSDVAVRHCTFSDSPVYIFLHKYAGMSAADYLTQYRPLEYRSGIYGPDGQLCAERYLKTFSGDDGVTYNSKIVHFLSQPFLVEINATAELYSRADIEQVTIQFDGELGC